MTKSEKELENLKESILLFKNKLEMDRYDNEQLSSTAISIIPKSNSNNLSSSTKYNFQLSSVDVYNNYTNEYDSRLVYQNKEYINNNSLDERIQLQIQEEFGSDDDDDDNNNNNNEMEIDDEMNNLLNSDIEDPYISRFNDILNSFKIDQLLKPITKPSDVINIKSINKIYKEKFLERLSNDTIRIIEKEQENVNLLNKIIDIFLHDDPDHLKADNLGLEDYDHHLDLEKNQNENQNENQNQNQNQNQKNGNLIYDDINDPFFKPPIYESDPQFDGIKQEEIDETRQLIQIALQRNEEFVRSLSQIRLGFLHADNYRENVYNWCKEMYENERIQVLKEKGKEKEKEREKEKETETEKENINENDGFDVNNNNNNNNNNN